MASGSRRTTGAIEHQIADEFCDTFCPDNRGHTGVSRSFRGSFRNSWRKHPAARRNELDDLLIAVGAKRDGKAFAVLFDHLQPRVRAQLI